MVSVVLKQLVNNKLLSRFKNNDLVFLEIRKFLNKRYANMRKIIPTILLVILAAGCNNSEHKKISEYHSMLDTLDINDYDSYRKYHQRISELKPIKESYCLLDSFKAEIDIKKNKLTYFIGSEREHLPPSLRNFPNYLENNYSINSIELLLSCIVSADDEYYECYERIMHKAIADKYGADFINDSKRIVDSIYLHHNKNLIYTWSDSYALNTRHRSKNYRLWKDSIQNEIRNIKHTIAFQPQSEEDYHFSAQFIITKSGKIDSLETYNIGYQDKKNDHLKKRLKEYILNTKWQPIELYGIKLNTKEHFFI